MVKHSYLAVIPARGGSKGIPGKNIKMIAGKPLIAWTIESAKKVKKLARVIVSTDDVKIARVAEKFGAEVLMRPAKLATDQAPMIGVLQHALKEIPSDHVVLLQPTSPVREKGLIDRCIAAYEKAKADNLATGFMCKFKEYGSYTANRQDLNGFFYNDGNVMIIHSQLLARNTLFGKKTVRFEIDKEQNVEIDDPFDFWLAEQILLKRKKT